MKLAKLSLAAMMVAGLASSSFAADTLADAFKNGSVKGEIKAYYFNNDNDTSREDIFTTGLMLNYKTATLYGFGANFTFQGSSSPFSDNDGEARYQGSMYGPGAVLSEAYLSYTLGKTTAMVGRMFLDTPLVSGSGSRIVKEAFEGAAIINTDLPDTTLIAGYVQKFQSRTNGEGDIGEFTKNFSTNSSANVDLDEGAYTFAVINKSIIGLTLTAAYVYADAYYYDVADAAVAINGGIHVGYAEALYEGKAGQISYVLGAQDYYNKFEDIIGVNDSSANLFAVKAGLSFKGINGTVAYSKSSDDNIPVGAVISGLGNGADLLYTDPVIAMNGYNVDTKSYLADLNYDISSVANVGARYVLADMGADIDEKISSTSVYGSYKFDGSLKGLSFTAQYEKQGRDADGDDLWVKANYKF